MKKYIVITSINPPTDAVIKYANVNEYHLIVVGDKKSPKKYELKNCQYISFEDQVGSDYKMVKNLPPNHYSRKMIGYLEAIKNGATVIVDTDDDNIPYENWSFPSFCGDFDSLKMDMGFINIYSLFSDKKIWPRGLPLSLINSKNDLKKSIKNAKCNIGIWQGLADEDPDVDAIYRLTDDRPCYFDKREPVVCKKGTISPFNTQNTLTRKELFPLLYLPTTVTFRYTDILRGLITQPIMWLYGYELGFTNATVIQKRNPHDYYKDFISEIPMYQTTEDVIEIVASSVCKENSIECNLYNSYSALYTEGIVKSNEMVVLEGWLNDLSAIL